MSELEEARLQLEEARSELRTLGHEILERSRNFDLLYREVMAKSYLIFVDAGEADDTGAVHVGDGDGCSQATSSKIYDDTIGKSSLSGQDSDRNVQSVLQHLDTNNTGDVSDTIAATSVSRHGFDSIGQPNFSNIEGNVSDIIEVISVSSSDSELDFLCFAGDVPDILEVNSVLSEVSDISDLADLQSIAGDMPDIEDVFSLSGHDSDSGYGGSNSSISLISDFSSSTAELRHNEENQFGYIVAPEHVIPLDYRLLSNQSRDPTRGVFDWREDGFMFEWEDRFDNHGYSYYTDMLIRNEGLPLRDCMSEIILPGDRKRKRIDPDQGLKSWSDVDCSYVCKKRKVHDV